MSATTRTLALVLGIVMAGGAGFFWERGEEPRERAGVRRRAMELNSLTPEEAYVIRDKGTEAPFSGAYWNHFEPGIYICRQCSAPLYRAEDKFESHCGWPSFDDEIGGAVRRSPDADGRRIEITCAACGGHLGHVFQGERHTERDTRHCVNSLSMAFHGVASGRFRRALFASGCFWGVEYHFSRAEGVVGTSVGFCGGHTESPTYREVCAKDTGHVETVEVIYDNEATTYEALVKLFFETHDPAQADGQGPDIGEQYRSVIFVCDEKQQRRAERLIGVLREQGLDVVTQIRPAERFWEAEDDHQDYYDRKGGQPYCHAYTKRFDD